MATNLLIKDIRYSKWVVEGEKKITVEMIEEFIDREIYRILHIAYGKELIDDSFCLKFGYKLVDRKTSWGGTGTRYYSRYIRETYPRISIGIGPFINRKITDKVVEFTEYNHIKDDPEIGNYYLHLREWRIYFTILLCHEIAHAIDHWKWKVPTINGEKWYWDRKNCGAHKLRWQTIYRILRTSVNIP